MSYTDSELRAIYARTDGYCHICHGKVYFKNYALSGSRGAWEVEHSIARARGGSNHGNNLRPAHIRCNRVKGAKTTRAARANYGNSSSPFSKAKKERLRKETIVGCGALGALLGLVGGPVGMIVGGGIGAAIGGNIKPPKV